jgi:alpha-L-rhamnosidase
VVGATAQHVYRVEATVDSEVAADDGRPFLRPWPFAPLGSRARVSWRVQVRTDGGWRPWSEPDRFETGLLDRADWQARIVGAPDAGPAAAGAR